MSMRRLLMLLLLSVGVVAPSAQAAGFDAFVVPVTGASPSTYYPSVIGPDGAYYSALENSIGRIATDGTASAFHTFGGFDSFNSTTDLGINSDGAYPTQVLLGSDGSLYGLTGAGGAFGFGTLFRLDASGALTTIYHFDYRSLESQTGPNYLTQQIVLGNDGAFYGLGSLDAMGSPNPPTPMFFRVGSDGSYRSICTLPIPGYAAQKNSFSQLIAGNDGNFYGVLSTQTEYVYTTVFKLTPDCGYSEVYTGGQDIVSLVLAADGNFYALDQGNPNYFSAGKLLRISKSGQATTLQTFDAETYRLYQPGEWNCSGGHCAWTPGRWYSLEVSLNAAGYAPAALMQARDGTLYGTTFREGLDGYGTLFTLAADGTFTTLMSLPVFLNQPLMEDAADNLIGVGQGNVLKLVPGLPLSTTVSFSQSKVWLWQPTTLTWSSSGAQSCILLGDIPGVSGSVAPSGSMTVKITSTQLRSPAAFVAGIQCTAADGSISNAAATLTIK